MNRGKTKYFKRLVLLNLLGCISLNGLAIAEGQEVQKESPSFTDTAYLKSGHRLKDYILDTGDTLSIEFVDAPELSTSVTVDPQGQIYLHRIKNAYVRGLTIKELTRILEKRYEEFLLSPEIFIKITTFKSIRISVNGEVRNPGLYRFSPFTPATSGSKLNETERMNLGLENTNTYTDLNDIDPIALDGERVINNNVPTKSSSEIKRSSEFITTLSNAITRAGGLTSYSDLSKIRIVRDIPLGKGGGKKRAIIDFNPYLRDSISSSDLRLFDGDSIFIPRLEKADPTILQSSILSGLTPKFIFVTIGGKIETPGIVKVPLESALSDVMNLSGPRKPLSGKIFLIRYNKDGTLLRKNIRYSSNATPGSLKNPYLLSGDLISVKNSILGRSAGNIKEITAPVVGIYTFREVLKNW